MQHQCNCHGWASEWSSHSLDFFGLLLFHKGWDVMQHEPQASPKHLLNLWDVSVGRSQTFEPNKEKSGAKPLVKPWVDGSFWTSNQSVKRAVPFWSSTFVGTAVKLDNWVVIIVLHDTHLLTRLAISPPFAKESALQWHHLRAPALGSCTDGQGTLEKSTPG